MDIESDDNVCSSCEGSGEYYDSSGRAQACPICGGQGRIYAVDHPILPGAMVTKRSRPELDPREVISIGRDFLTIDILGKESPRLPLDDYEVDTPAEGRL